jgi:hypothetical protein
MSNNPNNQDLAWHQRGSLADLELVMDEGKHLDDENGWPMTAQKIRSKCGFTDFSLKFFNEKLTQAYEKEWEDGLAPVILHCLVKDREDRKDGHQRVVKEVREMHPLLKRFPLKIFTEKLKEARAENPLPPKWPKSLAKVHLRELIEVGFDRDNEGNNLPIQDIFEMDERFSLYPSFQKYLHDMRNNVNQLQLNADRDQRAINHHLEKYPPSQMDARRIDIHGNWIQYPKWQGSIAKVMLLQDLIFVIQHDFLRGPNRIKPEKWWLSSSEYKKYPLKVFREHIYQEIRSMKQTNWNNYKKNKDRQKLK